MALPRLRKGSGVAPAPSLCFVTAGLGASVMSMLVCAHGTSRAPGSGHRVWCGPVLWGRASASCFTCQLLSRTRNPFGKHKLLSMRRIQGVPRPSLHITLPLFRLEYQNLTVRRVSAKKSIISGTAEIIAPIDPIGRRAVGPPQRSGKIRAGVC